jgi:hypothetical protein
MNSGVKQGSKYLFFHDGPGGTVVDFYTGTAFGAFFHVDNIGPLSLADIAGGTFEKAAAALDAICGDFIPQTRCLLIRTLYSSVLYNFSELKLQGLT